MPSKPHQFDPDAHKNVYVPGKLHKHGPVYCTRCHQEVLGRFTLCRAPECLRIYRTEASRKWRAANL